MKGFSIGNDVETTERIAVEASSGSEGGVALPCFEGLDE